MLNRLLVCLGMTLALALVVPTDAAACNGRCSWGGAGCATECGFSLFQTGNYCRDYCHWCAENPCLPGSIFLESKPSGANGPEDSDFDFACASEDGVDSPEVERRVVAQVKVHEPRS